MGRGAPGVAGRHEGVSFLDGAGNIAGAILHSISLAKDVGIILSGLPGDGTIFRSRPWAALNGLWTLCPNYKRSPRQLLWPLHRNGGCSIEKGGPGPHAVVNGVS